MAQSKDQGDSPSKGVSKKDRIGIFERYKDFLEEHLSRDDHNVQRAATRVLTVKTKGTFDYVSVEWEIHEEELHSDHPDVKPEHWTLWGLRNVTDFSRLNRFPKEIEGEVFLQSSQPKGCRKEYLKADSSANYAFFLVGRYQSFLKASQEKIVGPLSLSLTPLRASTQEMWKEIAEIGEAAGGAGSRTSPALSTKIELLDEFTEKESAILRDASLDEEQKQTKIERLWMLYSLFGSEGS